MKSAGPPSMATTPAKAACLELNEAGIIDASSGLSRCSPLVVIVQH